MTFYDVINSRKAGFGGSCFSGVRDSHWGLLSFSRNIAVISFISSISLKLESTCLRVKH